MSQSNASRHQTAFTVSIEAREGVTTGISAADRAHTIAVAINPEATRDDIATPGHVFPLMAREGGVVPGYDEAPVVAHMKGKEVAIAIDLGLGRGQATVWTCDLTHGYIDINGSYRS